MKDAPRCSGDRAGPTRLHSSGGVIVSGRDEDLRVAVMRSRYGTWVLPKGGLEPGEDPGQAARREVREEIGLEGLIEIEPLGATEHCFEREGRPYAKRVDWFLFEAEAGAKLRPCPAQGALDCGWFGPRQALWLLSHADQRQMLRRALALLRRR